MNDIAVSVDGISKQYSLRGQASAYRTLRDVLSRDKEPTEPTKFWALNDVSFEIQRGEVVGLIGGNGAGKSTLLKILSRITTPTRGRAELHGRVGSLLEVGTGFHAELTGRENIMLNGSILGMSRQEIVSKFDEIVSFAGVEQFLDLPVKRYSSGMQLRLAFSVAAHLDPEILLIDEVLAVGDTAFQRKCLGKMEEVRHLGRTVIVVSHNMGVIRDLCESTVVLSKGKVIYRGSVEGGLNAYARSLEETTIEGSALSTIRINGQLSSEATWSSDQPGAVSVQFGHPIALSNARLILILEDAAGRVVLHDRHEFNDLAAGSHTLTVDVPPLWLAPGAYSIAFKLLGVDEHGESLRLTSNRELLDLSSPLRASGLSSAMLSPKTSFRIGPP